MSILRVRAAGFGLTATDPIEMAESSAVDTTVNTVKPVASMTEGERQHFAAWLEGEAQSGRALIEQLEKLGGPPMAVLLIKHKIEVAAAMLIASKLRSIEDQTIGGSEMSDTKQAGGNCSGQQSTGLAQHRCDRSECDA